MPCLHPTCNNQHPTACYLRTYLPEGDTKQRQARSKTDASLLVISPPQACPSGPFTASKGQPIIGPPFQSCGPRGTCAVAQAKSLRSSFRCTASLQRASHLLHAQTADLAPLRTAAHRQFLCRRRHRETLQLAGLVLAQASESEIGGRDGPRGGAERAIESTAFHHARLPPCPCLAYGKVRRHTSP